MERKKMATENHIADDRKKVRLIDANAMREDWLENGENEYVYDTNAVLDSIDAQPTVDAIPVEDIKLHHILINNEGVPEVKLQIGERYFILYTEPVDVREVVHGRWEWLGPNSLVPECMCGTCSVCKVRSKYIVNTDICPNCGAKMDRERRTDG